MNDLSPEKLARAIRSETSLICINQVCNETGRIHPLKPVAEFCSVRIILATGRNEKEASGTVRISMGRGNTEESVKELGRALLDHIICNYR